MNECFFILVVHSFIHSFVRSLFFLLLLLLLQIIASMSTARNALVHEPFATDFHGRRALFQSPPVDDGIVIRIGRPDDAVLHRGLDDARRFLRTRGCAQKRVVVENVLTLQLALELRLVQTRRVFEVGHHPAARRSRRVERVRLRVAFTSYRIVSSVNRNLQINIQRARACVILETGRAIGGAAHQPADWNAPRSSGRRDNPLFSLSLRERRTRERNPPRKRNTNANAKRKRSFTPRINPHRVGTLFNRVRTKNTQVVTPKHSSRVHQRSIRIDSFPSHRIRRLPRVASLRTLTTRLTVSLAHLRSISLVVVRRPSAAH